MKKFLLAIVSTLSISAPVALRADPVADAVTATAQQLQTQLPKRIDERTTLLAVVAAGRRLKYSYRLDEKGALPEPWEKQQADKLRYNVCSHPAMRKMMGLGVSYSYL